MCHTLRSDQWVRMTPWSDRAWFSTADHIKVYLQYHYYKILSFVLAIREMIFFMHCSSFIRFSVAVRCYWHTFIASFIDSLSFRGSCKCSQKMCKTHSLRNHMSRKLGLTVAVETENEYEALEFIYSLERVFQLVLITELMDESLIRLRGGSEFFEKPLFFENHNLIFKYLSIS